MRRSGACLPGAFWSFHDFAAPVAPGVIAQPEFSELAFNAKHGVSSARDLAML